MNKTYLPYTPDQPFLLEPCPQDWLPEDHLAYQVRDLVHTLNLGAIHRSYLKSYRGAPPFDPTMIVSILVYAWCNSVYSSRNIAKLSIVDIGGRYLSAGHQPDFRTISLFCLRHGDALAGLFLQSLQICQAAGMVSLGHVALDGTKMKANASKHKAMSYGHMVKTEGELRSEIAEIQRRQKSDDAADDSLFGKDNASFDLPKELQFRKTRLKCILEAKAQIEAQAKVSAEAKAAEREAQRAAIGDPPDKPRKGRKPNGPSEAVPKDKAQRNFTDPESRIMKSGTGEYIQGYNGQAAVDSDHQVIVACDLTNMAADSPHFQPLLQQVGENTGGEPIQKSADAGYFSKDNINKTTTRCSATFIPPDRKTHAEQRSELLNPAIPEATIEVKAVLSISDKMRNLLDTEDGRKAYAMRKKTVEPVFGQIKGCPGSEGIRQFLRRGLHKTRQEWKWICAAHNFKKYMRHNLALKQANPA